MTNNVDKTNEETKITTLEEGRGQTGTPKSTVEESQAAFNQDESWKELERRTKDLEKQTSKIEDKLDRFDDKIKDSNLKTIETLGIFIALFSFVSVSFNIFNRIADLWSAGIFSLLVFFALSLMIILLDILLNRPQGQGLDFRFMLIVLFVILIGISLYFLRFFPINPIPNTLEFEASIDTKLDSKIENHFNKNNKKFYQKSEIDYLLKQPR